MGQPSTKQNGCTVLNVPDEKAIYLVQLALLNVETLRILSDLSKYRNIEKKLKDNAGILKILAL